MNVITLFTHPLFTLKLISLHISNHAIALYVGNQLISNMVVAMPILSIQLSLYIIMDMCKIVLILNLFFRSIYFNV